MRLEDSRVGNRFDSLTGEYSVLYFSSTLEGCFGETLARYRRDPALSFIEDEWRERGFMEVGGVPRDWRERRTAVRVAPSDEIPTVDFLNVEHPQNLKLLWKELAPILLMFEVTELDVSVIRGPDRRVTRAISQWAWQQRDEDDVPLFSGVRYLSRLHSGWECWALFDDIDVIEEERVPILHSTPGLEAAAKYHDLVVH